MAKIDKYYGGIDYQVSYNYQDKKKNVSDYVKYMLDRSLAMFHYENLPETLPHEEMERMLQTNGYVAIADVDGDLYAFNGGLGGEGDVYNRPTNITISNPYLKFNKTLKIDEECIIIKNDSMTMGLIPMYEKYCTMLNESDISIILATINKRIQILLSANDDNTVQSAKQFLQNVENGKLGVIAETKLFDSLKVNNSANSSNVNLRDLFELHQYIKASMFNEIGLNANNNLKREHILNAEVESNSDNLYPLVDDMYSCRKQAIEKVNEMFGTDITVEFNSSWDYRVFNGEPINSHEYVAGSEETTDNEVSDTSNEEITDNKTEVNDNEKISVASDEQSEKRQVPDEQPDNVSTSEEHDSNSNVRTANNNDEEQEEQEESEVKEDGNEKDDEEENR